MAGILLNRSRQVPAEETPAFGGIAERFRRAGDLDRAIALCRDGLKRFPDQLSARVTLGWALLDKGQYDEARGELERVLRKAPDNLAAIRGLAELHDRSEGAMPALDDKQWQQAEEPAAKTPPQPVPLPAVSPMPAPVVIAAPAVVADAPIVFAAPASLPAVDPFAPISLSLPAGNATVELLQTAEQAGRVAAEAAAGHEFHAPHADDTPVELEDPAAATMAAAATPVSFFAESVPEVAVAAGPAPEDVAAAAAEIEAEIARLAELPSLIVESESPAFAFETVAVAPDFELTISGDDTAVEPVSLTFEEIAAPAAAAELAPQLAQAAPGVEASAEVPAASSDFDLDLAIQGLEADAEAVLDRVEAGEVGEAPSFVPTAVSFEPFDTSLADAGPFEDVDVVLEPAALDVASGAAALGDFIDVGATAPAAEPTGPVFELHPPDVDPAALETAGVELAGDVVTARDEFTGDLIALTEIEPEPVPESIAESAVECVAEPVAEVAVAPVVEPVAEFAAEPVAEPVAEPAVEFVAEPVAEVAVAPGVAPVFEPVAEPAVEFVAEPVAEVAVAPVVAPAFAPVAESVTEAVAESVVAPVFEPPVEFALAAVAEPVRELVAEPVTRLVALVVPAVPDVPDVPAVPDVPDALGPLGVVLGLPVRRSDHARMTLARLERFLRQVEARRVQLRSQTVA